MAMGVWRQRLNQKGVRASREPGKKKGILPSTLQRSYCKRARSYKWPKYEEIMSSLGSRKKK
jgi:hypothetical protein